MWLWWMLLGQCQHEQVTWPQKGRQVCLECGMHRPYRFTSQGIVKGRWRVDHEAEKQRQRVFVMEEVE